MLPSRDGVALDAGTWRLRAASTDKAFDFWNFSIVGQAEGDGMMMEGYRLGRGLDSLNFLTELEHVRSTSSDSSSVTSYKSSNSVRLAL